MQYKFKGVVYKTQALMKAAQRADAAARTGNPVRTVPKQKRPSAKKPDPYDVVDVEWTHDVVFEEDTTTWALKLILKGEDEAGVERVPAVNNGRLLSVRIKVLIDDATKFAWYHLVSDTCSQAVTATRLRAAGAKYHSKITDAEYDVPVVIPQVLLDKEGDVPKKVYLLACAAGVDGETVTFKVMARYAVSRSAAAVVHF